jgi:hypothetical protein
MLGDIAVIESILGVPATREMMLFIIWFEDKVSQKSAHKVLHE